MTSYLNQMLVSVLITTKYEFLLHAANYYINESKLLISINRISPPKFSEFPLKITRFLIPCPLKNTTDSVNQVTDAEQNLLNPERIPSLSVNNICTT